MQEVKMEQEEVEEDEVKVPARYQAAVAACLKRKLVGQQQLDVAQGSATGEAVGAEAEEAVGEEAAEKLLENAELWSSAVAEAKRRRKVEIEKDELEQQMQAERAQWKKLLSVLRHGHLAKQQQQQQQQHQLIAALAQGSATAASSTDAAAAAAAAAAAEATDDGASGDTEIVSDDADDGCQPPYFAN